MKLKGWIAMDKDDRVYLHPVKPYRHLGFDWWWNETGSVFKVEQSLFTTLTWEDEPIEVEIEIKEVKK